jgi:pimeloyl-ACP methyl ester carboxylesterase
VTAPNRSGRQPRRARIDPCGPAGLRLPDGDTTTIQTDDGASLAVTVAGPDTGSAVVLSHCWTGHQGVWGAVARRLVLGGHRVVLYDHRGHGCSTMGRAAPTVARLGADLRLVLEQLDVHDAVLAGHSMGGMAVQSFAIDQPDALYVRARSLVLVATAARVLNPPLPAPVVEWILGEGRGEWWQSGRRGLVVARRAVGRRPHPAHVEVTRDGLVSTSAAARTGFLAAMGAMDLRSQLSSITLPVTVLVGTKDRLTPVRLGRSLANRIPGAQLVILPGAGHMLPLEEPDRIVDAIRS